MHHAPGKLVEIEHDDALIRLPYREVVRMRLSEAQLRRYAKAHGYKPGWVWYRLKEMQAKELVLS